MATPVLDLKVDPEKFPFRCVVNARGTVITRVGIVNTLDPVAARTAVGMPAYGDAYSATEPGIVFQGVEIENMGGIATGDGTGGWSKATLTWATPTFSGLPSGPGDPWTEIQINVEGQKANFAPAGAVGGWDLNPVNNGDGIQIETGLVTANVHTFYDTSTVYPYFPRLLDLSKPNKINDGPLLLPRIVGTQARFSMAAGQVRYRAFSVPVPKGSVLEIVHQLVLAPDQLSQWIVKNKEGRRVADAQVEMYERASMDGLW